jgi:hypothetical protein
MTATSVIPAELIAAYRATTYRVDAPALIIHLNIGQYNKELAALHFQHCVTTSAFITAYNPYSIDTAPEVNRDAHKALIADIESMHLPWLNGAGEDADTDWLPEESVLVLGISLAQANTLAHKYKQNAFVFIDESAIPALHLCR